VDPLEALAVAAAAFLAGGINAAGGGGSLITFPVLVATGFDAKMANVTNTVGLVPGLIGGSLGYRAELGRQPGNIRLVLPATILGALTGSTILLVSSEASFEAIVPFLILTACALLTFQDRINRAVLGAVVAGQSEPALHSAWLYTGVFVSAVYGAYFGAGLGIILFVVLGLTLPDDIQRTNALRGIIALFTNGLAAGYFAVLADVDWQTAGLMALTSVCGGYLGARIARKLSRRVLRTVVISYGALAAGYLLVR
jgi:uncharacterized membrane protein YfcA